ncbi:MAG: GNAT family N-acetyltransferase [Ignavibacteria bacterium]|nr:GNAT family N-acetyltransferase [Ignavibacteria bacterium]
MINTERAEVTLRALCCKDNVELSRLANNKKISRNMRDVFPYPYSLTDADWFINRCQGQNPQLDFAIEYMGKLAGVIGLMPQTDIYRFSAEAGYWLGEEYWGKGIATAAMKTLVTYAFSQLGYARLFAGVFDYNIASQKVLEKSGFTLMAVYRQAVVKNNTVYSEHHYEIYNENFSIK